MYKRLVLYTAIIVTITLASFYWINTHNFNVTHKDFTKSMKHNPQHAYYYLSSKVKKQVTLRDMASYKSLATSFKKTAPQTNKDILVKHKTITADLDPLDHRINQRGKVSLTYGMENGRWVITNVRIISASVAAN